MEQRETQAPESLGGDLFGKLQRNLTMEGFYHATGQCVLFRLTVSARSLSQGKHRGLK